MANDVQAIYEWDGCIPKKELHKFISFRDGSALMIFNADQKEQIMLVRTAN